MKRVFLIHTALASLVLAAVLPGATAAQEAAAETESMIEIEVPATEAERELLRAASGRGLVTLPTDHELLLEAFKRQAAEGELEREEIEAVLQYLLQNGHLRSLPHLPDAPAWQDVVIDYAPLANPRDLAAVMSSSVVDEALSNSDRIKVLGRSDAFIDLMRESRDTPWFSNLEFEAWEIEARPAPLVFYSQERAVEPGDEQRRIEKLPPPDLEPEDPYASPELEVACTLAIRELAKATRACTGRPCFNPFVTRTEKVKELERQILEKARPYDRQCLASRLGDDDRPADPFPSPIGELQAAQVVGVLEARGLPPGEEGFTFCGALMLDRELIATARHCFFDDYGSLRRVLRGREIRLYRSDLIGSEGSRVIVEPVAVARDRDIPSGDLLRHRNDYLLLRLADPIDGVPPVRFANAIQGDRLWVYGHYRFFDRTRRLREGEKTAAWSEGLRWSKATRCVALAEENECMVHSCQTEHGFSGTPIISRRPPGPDGEVTVVGLQISAPNVDAKDCLHLDPEQNFNAALAGDYLATEVLAGVGAGG